jgi:hypothetical protein
MFHQCIAITLSVSRGKGCSNKKGTDQCRLNFERLRSENLKQ